MNDTTLPGQINILENADRSVFPKMNDRMITIFENESAYSVGRSVFPEGHLQKGSLRVISQYAAS